MSSEAATKRSYSGPGRPSLPCLPATEAVEAAMEAPVRCLGCGRPLRSEAGRLRRRGERCWRKLRRAARWADAGDSYLAERAAQLLTDGALLRLSGHAGRAWAVVASDGSRQYLTTPEGCNCEAWRCWSRFCHHQLGVTLLLAA